MKILLFIISLILVSCSTTYREVWIVDRYPVKYQDTIVITYEHLHYCDKSEWHCFEFENDTNVVMGVDTLDLMILQNKYKIKKNERYIKIL
jgi:hypothetical protein